MVLREREAENTFPSLCRIRSGGVAPLKLGDGGAGVTEAEALCNGASTLAGKMKAFCVETGRGNGGCVRGWKLCEIYIERKWKR